jgi:hypothetical protein
MENGGALVQHRRPGEKGLVAPEGHEGAAKSGTGEA